MKLKMDGWHVVIRLSSLAKPAHLSGKSRVVQTAGTFRISDSRQFVVEQVYAHVNHGYVLSQFAQPQ